MVLDYTFTDLTDGSLLHLFVDIVTEICIMLLLVGYLCVIYVKLIIHYLF